MMKSNLILVLFCLTGLLTNHSVFAGVVMPELTGSGTNRPDLTGRSAAVDPDSSISPDGSISLGLGGLPVVPCAEVPAGSVSMGTLVIAKDKASEVLKELEANLPSDRVLSNIASVCIVSVAGNLSHHFNISTLYHEIRHSQEAHIRRNSHQHSQQILENNNLRY